jgi:heme exporter protein CcmD
MDWSMGGYGFYVWGSYLSAFVVIGLEVFSLTRRNRSCAQMEQSNRKEKQRDDNAGMVVEI